MAQYNTSPSQVSDTTTITTTYHYLDSFSPSKTTTATATCVNHDITSLKIHSQDAPAAAAPAGSYEATNLRRSLALTRSAFYQFSSSSSSSSSESEEEMCFSSDCVSIRCSIPQNPTESSLGQLSSSRRESQLKQTQWKESPRNESQRSETQWNTCQRRGSQRKESDFKATTLENESGLTLKLKRLMRRRDGSKELREATRRLPKGGYLTALWDLREIAKPLRVHKYRYVKRAARALASLQDAATDPYPPRKGVFVDITSTGGKNFLSELQYFFMASFALYRPRNINKFYGASFKAVNSAQLIAEMITGTPDDRSGRIEIIRYAPTAYVNRPSYCLFIDHGKKYIVLSIRGSNDVSDACTDFKADILPDTRTHEGMERASQWFDVTERQEVIQLCIKYPSYSTRLCGHSLGGGVAGLLAMKWLKSRDIAGSGPARKKLMCYAFGSPCTCTPDVASQFRDHIISIACGYDLVSRSSLGSIERTANMINYIIENTRSMPTNSRILRTWNSVIGKSSAAERPTLGENLKAAKKIKKSPSLVNMNKVSYEGLAESLREAAESIELSVRNHISEFVERTHEFRHHGGHHKGEIKSPRFDKLFPEDSPITRVPSSSKKSQTSSGWSTRSPGNEMAAALEECTIPEEEEGEDDESPGSTGGSSRKGSVDDGAVVESTRFATLPRYSISMGTSCPTDQLDTDQTSAIPHKSTPSHEQTSNAGPGYVKKHRFKGYKSPDSKLSITRRGHRVHFTKRASSEAIDIETARAPLRKLLKQLRTSKEATLVTLVPAGSLYALIPGWHLMLAGQKFPLQLTSGGYLLMDMGEESLSLSSEIIFKRRCITDHLPPSYVFGLGIHLALPIPEEIASEMEKLLEVADFEVWKGWMVPSPYGFRYQNIRNRQHYHLNQLKNRQGVL